MIKVLGKIRIMSAKSIANIVLSGKTLKAFLFITERTTKVVTTIFNNYWGVQPEQ